MNGRHVAITLFFLLLVCTGVGNASDFDIPVATNEQIADAVAFDDGTAVVAVASLRPRASRLFTIANGTVTLAAMLPGITVTELRWGGISGDQHPRILVGGGVDRPGAAEYQYRLVELGPDAGFVTLWDSSILRDQLDEEDAFEFSRTAWAVLRQTPKQCVVEYGAFGSSRTVRAVLDAGGGDTTLGVADAGPRAAIIIVVRGGAAYALDTSKARPYLSKLPMKDVSRVLIDAATQTVKLTSGSSTKTYSLKQILARSLEAPLAVARDRERGRRSPSLSGKVYEGLDASLVSDFRWWRVSPTAKVLLGLRKGTTATISMRSTDQRQPS
ncbi:MAG: hypothetical protein M3P29_03150 [Acidobacteriota bacterium]|nr:hypothetical protein [Acidobacteriota bacterium]